MSFQLETPRLVLREMTWEDYPALCRILQDDQVMYAYEGAFDQAQTQAWLQKQRIRYESLGFGLWAAVLKETGEMIGQCGLTMQDWKDRQVLEIGYLFQKAFWHQGYAAIPTLPPRGWPDETGWRLSIPPSGTIGALICPTFSFRSGGLCNADGKRQKDSCKGQGQDKPRRFVLPILF